MADEFEWGELITSADLRPVWKGQLQVSDRPRTVVWWLAWDNVSGGLNVMHVGVSVLAGADVYGEPQELARRMMTGVVNMCWRSVGNELPIETSPLTIRRFSTGEGWIGKVVVRAYTGRQFDPLMLAIQTMKEAVEDGA